VLIRRQRILDEDALAEEPVLREPVCEANSLLTGNLTGNFSNLGLFLRFSLLINGQIQMLAAKFPSKWNREIFLTEQGIIFAEQGILAPNRELDLGSIF
jgi:hypothetical protein